MSLEPYTAAVCSMTGMTFDSIGGLYLAYDLLGGHRGPLGMITRIVTYSLIAFVFYAFALNLKFALIAGIGMGAIFGYQLELIGSGHKLTKKFLITVAFVRMIILTVAGAMVLSRTAACFMGVSILIGSLMASKFKYSPDYWYEASTQPQFRPRRLVVGITLGIMVSLMAWLGETVSGVSNPLPMALRLGLVIGLGTALIATVSPFVEWYADNLPPKRMGYIGVVMFLLGFAIQSIPSLVVLLGF